MKVVIAGGSGQVGQILARDFLSRGDEVVVLHRGSKVLVGRAVSWDGRAIGAWAQELDGCEVVINLAGRTVNCRYSEKNLREMLESRVDSTRVIGKAIEQAKQPPRLWLQMSTATIYAHRFDAANGESSGLIGGGEVGVPAYWVDSVNIARAWEAALAESVAPATRKIALRTSMVMSADEGGIFTTLLGLVRRGLGGSAAGGQQFVSWIHEEDFVRAVAFLIAHEELAGAVNMAAPQPLPYADFMRAMREALRIRIALPAAKWMLEIGAWAMRTDTELVLKSRRVVPERLLQAGFVFKYANWSEAAAELIARWKARPAIGA